MARSVLIAEDLQSRLGAGSDTEYEVMYYLWRRKRRAVPWFAAGRYRYEIWVTALPRRLSAGRGPSPESASSLSPESASSLGEDLKQAIAGVAAGRVTATIWKIDDLSEGQAAALIDMPDKLQRLVDEPLRAAVGATGMPDPVAAVSADATGTLLLKPVMGPVKKALHRLEIVGVIAGLVTGLHGLSALCLKHLVHDRTTRMLGEAFSRAISQPGARELDKRPSADAGPEAPSRRRRQSPQPPRFRRVSPSYRSYREEPEEPQRLESPADPSLERRVAAGTAASRYGRPSREDALPSAVSKELRSRDPAAWYTAAYHRGPASRG